MFLSFSYRGLAFVALRLFNVASFSSARVLREDRRFAGCSHCVKAGGLARAIATRRPDKTQARVSTVSRSWVSTRLEPNPHSVVSSGPTRKLASSFFPCPSRSDMLTPAHPGPDKREPPTCRRSKRRVLDLDLFLGGFLPSYCLHRRLP